MATFTARIFPYPSHTSLLDSCEKTLYNSIVSSPNFQATQLYPMRLQYGSYKQMSEPPEAGHALIRLSAS